MPARTTSTWGSAPAPTSTPASWSSLAHRAPAGDLRAARLEGRDGGLRRGHRRLAAARGELPADAALPGGLPGVPEPGLPGDQVGAAGAGPRPAGGAARAGPLPAWPSRSPTSTTTWPVAWSRWAAASRSGGCGSGRLVEAGLEPTVLVAPWCRGWMTSSPGCWRRRGPWGSAGPAGSSCGCPAPRCRIFEERLRQALPERADRILHLIRETRLGELHDPRFGSRFRGEGPYAETIAGPLPACCSRLDVDAGRRRRAAGPPTFRRPDRGGQLGLFAAG